ncbi:MAG: glutathione S-transferase [Paracoccaceae bacterium]
MIRLHHVPFSRSFRVLWLLHEMGLDCDIRKYSISDGSLRHPDFLAISPAGRVPALEIDGRVLFESGAITEYLCETRPEHGFGRPAGHPERVEWLEWLHYAETMAQLLANLNLQWVFLRDPATRSDTVVKIEAKRLANTLKPLEQLLRTQDHVLASGFSGVDTMLGYNLLAVPYYVRLEPFPAIRAYLGRIGRRPAFQAARRADGEELFYTQDFYEVADG